MANPLAKTSQRKEKSIMNRLRIRHTRLTHGFLMSKNDPPLCETCGTILTIKHIITEYRKKH